MSNGYENLTQSEHRIIRAMLDGYWTNAQIAEHLVISPRTVQSHLRNVFAKTGANNRLELCLNYLTKVALFGA